MDPICRPHWGDKVQIELNLNTWVCYEGPAPEEMLQPKKDE